LGRVWLDYVKKKAIRFKSKQDPDPFLVFEK
jgi:hypothetical protein